MQNYYMKPQKNKLNKIIPITLFAAVIIAGVMYLGPKKEAAQSVSGIEVKKVVDSPVTPTATKTAPVVPKTIVEEKKVELEPFSYSTTGLLATVTKETIAFDYTANQLELMADACQTAQEANYFTQLVAKFKNTDKIVYSFKYQGKSQENDTYIITLIPNKAAYTSLEKFKMDFNICGVGAAAYPTMLSKNWLLFESSCSGVDDGSGRAFGCDEISKIIEPSLKLK